MALEGRLFNPRAIISVSFKTCEPCQRLIKGRRERGFFGKRNCTPQIESFERKSEKGKEIEDGVIERKSRSTIED